MIAGLLTPGSQIEEQFYFFKSYAKRLRLSYKQQ
jgi:hypothetical protein